ncbi:MAG: hypothetical protein NC347_05685 [Clostridium sp.]|nr:hypothetical protein [Clostridium sp.]
MLRLIPFELGKLLKKKSFLLSICFLLLLHLFLLWYTSLPDEAQPPLSAYKAIGKELQDKSEAEKGNYIQALKEKMDGILFVRDILAMQSFHNEMGDALASQELQSQPDVFERYYEPYQSGDYLAFTGSLEQECSLIDEIYAEWQTVSAYGEYLASIQEQKEALSGISIWSGTGKDSFSSRNLQKSAADYAGLTGQTIRFAPSKGLVSAMEAVWADWLLFLGMMLFVASMITEEKEKKLFFITRSTKHGQMDNMASRLAALLIYCVLLTVLFYSVSIIFFGQSTGWFDFTAGIQSAATYAAGSLPISILGYILLSVLTKALVLFGTGAVLTIFCIVSEIAVLPFLAGAACIGVSALLYYLIPAGSPLSVFKYMNLIGLMKTENLYGSYLNFNLFQYSVARLGLSLGLILIVCVIGTAGGLWSFCHMKSFEIRKLKLPAILPFKPHTSIWRHEAYKILVTNQAFVILLLFSMLLVYKNASRTYTPSVREQYYQTLMAELEGELTGEKEALILAEQARFEEAMQKIEEIDGMIAAGAISDAAGDSLKAQANMTLAFYSAFQRAEEQYAHIKSEGGSFVYDTGYLYLFGAMEDAFSVDLLILTIGMILAVSGVPAMEYQSGSQFLIRAAKAGIRKIMVCKTLICSMAAAVPAIACSVSRICHIASVYPMQGAGADIRSISYFARLPFPMTIGCFVLLFVLSQLVAAMLITLAVIGISLWRKNQVQTVFFALLLLAVPLVLKLLGFEVAKWFSLYPLYGWTGML